LALDSSDNVFVAGDVNANTNLDGFVTEMNSTATAVIFTSTIGGTKTDSIRSIAVAGEEAYVTGYTNSTDFPVTAGVVQSSCGSSCSDYFNGFAAKVGAGGVSYATYLGGTVSSVTGTTFNLGIGIAVDSSGDAYVTGTTNTTDFPVTPGAFQTTYGGTTNLGGGVASCIDFLSQKLPCGDAYAVKLNPTGTAIDWATYLGGSTGDIGYAIKLDTSGNVWVGGYTQSFKATGHTPFPTTTNAFQSVEGGGFDIFLSEVSPTGSSLVYSTYLGGSLDEDAYALAIDVEGNGYLAGRTISTNSPVSSDAFQSTFHGMVDAYIVKIQP
jgi:hypothetical protein